MIYIVWPTVRPSTAKAAASTWKSSAANPRGLKFAFATTTDEDAKVFGEDGYAVGETAGCCKAIYALTKTMELKPHDILIVASDDVLPPSNWDEHIRYLMTRMPGMLLSDDGWHGNREIVPIPICDGYTLERLSRIIYHPSYHHLWADNELYANCNDMGFLVDVRSELKFNHVHHCAGKRKMDDVDKKIYSWEEHDRLLWCQRSKLSVGDRLVV